MDEEIAVGIHRRKTFVRAGLALSALCLMSCASTRMTSTWKDPNYTGGPLKKVAVFYVDKDESVRRSVEDQVARGLPAGTQGVPGYTLFPTLDKDIEKIRIRLNQEGFDGALVGRLVEIVRDVTRPQEATVVLGSPYMSVDTYSGTLDDDYGYAYSYAYEPRRRDTRYIVQTTLYKLPQGQPIWRGKSESVNPDSRQEVVAEVTRLLDADLRKDKLLGTP